MIYGGPGFLAVIWFGSSPTPCHLSPISKLSFFLSLPASILLGVGGGGWLEAKTYDSRKPEPLKIIQYSLGLHICLQHSACLYVCYLYVQCQPIVFSPLCPPPLSLFSILYCTVLVCLLIFLLALLIDSLPNWLTDWLADWLTDCLTDWLTDWLPDWVPDWLTAWLPLTDCVTDWPPAFYWLHD